MKLMAVLHRSEMNGRAAAFSAVMLALFLCLGCSGSSAMLSSRESRIEHLTRWVSFETRREQSAIAERSAWYHEPQLESYINQVLAALIPFCDGPAGVVWQIRMIRETRIDAYSFPDGAVYVHTGLLAQLENEAELAMLLAHELVHVTRQHAMQVLMHAGEEAGAPSADRDGSNPLSWFQEPAILPDRAGPSDRLLDLRQRLEWEADCLGLDMIVNANYDPHEALEIFEHLNASPGAQDSRERLARIYERLSPAISSAAAGQPSDRIAFGKRLHLLRVAQAELEIQHGRWDAALKLARHLAKNGPGHGQGHYLLGEIFRQRGDPEDEQKALMHYHQAIACDPSRPEPRKALGLIYLKSGQARRAKPLFQSALDLAGPSRDDAYIRSYLIQCDTFIEGENP
jgi:predicted Zn-dependent protease